MNRQSVTVNEPLPESQKKWKKVGQTSCLSVIAKPTGSMPVPRISQPNITRFQYGGRLLVGGATGKESTEMTVFPSCQGHMVSFSTQKIEKTGR